MQSAIWLIPLAWWLARGYDDPQASPLDSLYCALTALFWIGHRLCSAWLAYGTEAYRPLRRAHPVRFVVVPFLVTAGCLALLLPVDDALPWTRFERVVALAVLDYALVTYHFAAQHFGALSLYRVRLGGDVSPRARRRDWLFALGIGGVLVLFADVLAGAVAYQDLWVDRWLAPAWIAGAEFELRTGALVALLAGTTAMVGCELSSARRSVPRLLYILGIAGMVAIALRPRSPFLFLVLWTSQHWIVAVGLASQAPSHEPAPEHRGLRRVRHALNSRPVAVVLLLMTISVLLLPAFEVEASLETGSYYGDRIFGAVASELRTSSWVGVLLALGFASGFTHYLLDRSVFRLSDPAVRTAARGLLAANERPQATRTLTSAGRVSRVVTWRTSARTWSARTTS